MISLSVEEKCQDCPNFSPQVSQIDMTAFGDRRKRVQQTVCCGNKDFCDNIEEYLKNRE